MAEEDELTVSATFGAVLRKPNGGRKCEREFTEALEREGLDLLNRVADGLLFVANEGEEPTVIPDQLDYLISRVCFQAAAEVLGSGHYHIVCMGYMGSMDLVREDELTLIGGADFEANCFPTEPLLLALYQCGRRFVELLERLESESDQGPGMAGILRNRERAARATLNAATCFRSDPGFGYPLRPRRPPGTKTLNFSLEGEHHACT